MQVQIENVTEQRERKKDPSQKNVTKERKKKISDNTKKREKKPSTF